MVIIYTEWDITNETLRSCHHLVSATHLKTFVENLCGINTITEVYNVIKKFQNNYISNFQNNNISILSQVGGLNMGKMYIGYLENTFSCFVLTKRV